MTDIRTCGNNRTGDASMTTEQQQYQTTAYYLNRGNPIAALEPTPIAAIRPVAALEPTPIAAILSGRGSSSLEFERKMDNTMLMTPGFASSLKNFFFGGETANIAQPAATAATTQAKKRQLPPVASVASSAAAGYHQQQVLNNSNPNPTKRARVAPARGNPEVIMVPNPLFSSHSVLKADPAAADPLNVQAPNPLLQRKAPPAKPVASVPAAVLSQPDQQLVSNLRLFSSAVAQTSTHAAARPAQVVPSAPPALPPVTNLLESRKQRNREHSKKSREKKKNELELLQTELAQLQHENERLRCLVKTELPRHAPAIIGQHCYRNTRELSKQPYLVMPEQQADNDRGVYGESDFELIESLTQQRQSFVLTDPRLPDNPIVYASPQFLELTGYKHGDVIGRNCRFLQGPQTDETQVAKIKQGISQGQDVTVRLLNFKADGTPFWNQFFLAALHDRDNRIVNYVGVQCADEEETEAEDQVQTTETAAAAQQPGLNQGSVPPVPAAAAAAAAVPSQPAAPPAQTQQPGGPAFNLTAPPQAQTEPIPLEDPLPLTKHDSVGSMDVSVMDFGDDKIDWADLAKVMEADFHDGDDAFANFDYSNDLMQDSDEDASVVAPFQENAKEEARQPQPQTKTAAAATTTTVVVSNEQAQERPSSFSIVPSIQARAPAARQAVAQTLKSELIQALLDSNGDVTGMRFEQSLDLLSSMYQSMNRMSNDKTNMSLSPLVHGPWRDLSRPSFSGCLGQNENNDFVYTLGKMSFNMFKPGSLRCTVQRTIADIEPICDMGRAPRSAPFSLRRELAMPKPETSLASPNTMLKSYDINVALTIEPSDFGAEPTEDIPAPTCRLCAAYRVNGYFLPDPSTPNRLTVWFTGGKLSPAPPPSDEYGGLDEWKQLFSGGHKRTWGEKFSLIGAKVLLGAELSEGMDAGGTMSYTLHRPHGGHGKGYVDIIYLDEDLFITKGNYGTIHVMWKDVSGS